MQGWLAELAVWGLGCPVRQDSRRAAYLGRYAPLFACRTGTASRDVSRERPPQPAAGCMAQALVAAWFTPAARTECCWSRARLEVASCTHSLHQAVLTHSALRRQFECAD